MLGIGRATLRAIAVDGDCRMRADALEATTPDPFAVIAPMPPRPATGR
jgi:hypothetical protein